MRFCTKCGDYYADELLAFCLADGTPLVGVDPHGERWSEALRVVEEKEKALRLLKRRLRWRRLMHVATTTLVTTLVVCVVAVNGLIYLTPEPDETPDAAPSTPTRTLVTTPTTAVSRLRALMPDDVVITRLEPLPTPEPTEVPNKSLTPTPPGTRTPADDAPTPTPATPTPTTSETATPTPPLPPTPTPPTPTPTPSPTPTPTPVIITITPPKPPQAECSDADKDRERGSLINAYAGEWRRKIEGEREKIVARHKPDGAFGVEASLGEIEYQSLFVKACTVGFVTARYTWQVRSNVNGTVRVVPVNRARRFACVKLGGAWRCS